MKLLILGGTKFLGRALVDEALACNHEVTLFNRGQTNPDLYPDAERLTGDRDGDLGALEGREWDAVIDTCGYVPRIVSMSARLLADHVEHYTFISSISVYADEVYTAESPDESWPLQTLEDETVEEVLPHYGGLKALCEQAAEAALTGRTLNVRAGLIVGPYDPTDRFTYWPVNVQRKPRILAPPADASLQIIDVRDLAAWVVLMAEQRKAGIYNATGPDTTLTFGDMLSACQSVVGDAAAEIIHSSEAFLLENEVQPWADLPLWLPTHLAGMSRTNVSKAIADGLRFRPLEETIRATLDWYNAHHEADTALKAGISAEREAELLAKWQESVGA